MGSNHASPMNAWRERRWTRIAGSLRGSGTFGLPVRGEQGTRCGQGQVPERLENPQALSARRVAAKVSRDVSGHGKPSHGCSAKRVCLGRDTPIPCPGLVASFIARTEQPPARRWHGADHIWFGLVALQAVCIVKARRKVSYSFPCRWKSAKQACRVLSDAEPVPPREFRHHRLMALS
jgi:hypothetical protein